jgi:hypothetical protein
MINREKTFSLKDKVKGHDSSSEYRFGKTLSPLYAVLHQERKENCMRAPLGY